MRENVKNKLALLGGALSTAGVHVRSASRWSEPPGNKGKRTNLMALAAVTVSNAQFKFFTKSPI